MRVTRVTKRAFCVFSLRFLKILVTRKAFLSRVTIMTRATNRVTERDKYNFESYKFVFVFLFNKQIRRILNWVFQSKNLSREVRKKCEWQENPGEIDNFAKTSCVDKNKSKGKNTPLTNLELSQSSNRTLGEHLIFSPSWTLKFLTSRAWPSWLD